MHINGCSGINVNLLTHKNVLSKKMVCMGVEGFIKSVCSPKALNLQRFSLKKSSATRYLHREDLLTRRAQGYNDVVYTRRIKSPLFTHFSLSSSSACCLESWRASFSCISSSLVSVGRACSTFCSVRLVAESLKGKDGGEVSSWGRDRE